MPQSLAHTWVLLHGSVKIKEYTLLDNEFDILQLLEDQSSVFYEYGCDNGKLLKRAAEEIRELRNFRDAVFHVHPNVDLDIIEFYP